MSSLEGNEATLSLVRSLSRIRRQFMVRMQRLIRGIGSRVASSLTRRILVLNLAGLFALFVGFLYLNQFREGLIESRVQSLLTQGEIIAASVAASATVETDAISIDPDKLLQLQAGESLGLNEDALSPLEFSINPERVAPLLRRLVTPTRTRARIFDKEGLLALDSRNFYARGDILRFDLPPIGQPEEPTLLERTWSLFKNRLGRADLPTSDDSGSVSGRNFPEVVRALSGQPGSVVRVNTKGETIVSVAVPIQRLRSVQGALLLSTQGGDIDAIIATERYAFLRIFLVAAGVMTVLSVLLANTIAEPMRRLAAAAERVRRGKRVREEIPDYTDRHDEVGHLSGSLRDMTHALYNRIEAIESFAADVAHELKNPLTSLRSAVETLPLARTNDARDRLLAVVRHDVKRLDRLITDISDASRLDAELARADQSPVDVRSLLEAVVSIQNEIRRPGQPEIDLVTQPHVLNREAYKILGHDSRISQVIANLIENAKSFSPPDSSIRVELARKADNIIVRVEDEGPGIPPHALERIFERFYTDRPDHGFGQNSGLGLSISRQIVEAHLGQIQAENRPSKNNVMGEPADGSWASGGARFTVTLPALKHAP
jgi:two-component system, OmpR family, sensor histidine kinase ChvG